MTSAEIEDVFRLNPYFERDPEVYFLWEFADKYYCIINRYTSEITWLRHSNFEYGSYVVSFEDVLDNISEDARKGLLFHLDIFVPSNKESE